uniref:Uncharacterized protein n=1 Tax=Triticum urartu TaxID=4572 RepID=A0A8R7QR66_TRIUA
MTRRQGFASSSRQGFSTPVSSASLD